MGQQNKQKVVIIGGGFAGLQLCRKLRNKSGFHITLIDRENHHMFQPLFYQVATARLEPSSISFPFRKIFQRAKNIDFLLANVEGIDADNNRLQTDHGAVEYDILVIATGAYTNFFGNENVQKHSLSMKTTHEAIFIRNHLLLSFESMMQEKNDAIKENIVVVGGGPTGVELAGSFAEMKKMILPKDYPSLHTDRLEVYLIEGAEYPLNAMSEKAKTSAKKYLEKMGVNVLTNSLVQDYDGKKISLNTGEEISTTNVIWAAGVTGNVVNGLDKKSQEKGNRYKVNRQSKIDGYNNIYALGDVAVMQTEKYPNGHPQVANVAINQANTLAKNLKQPTANKAFEYKDLGSMATIGKHKAVVDLPFMQIKGWVAWFIWMFLHLMLILSVRNKLIIFINWAWSYLTRDTSLRLILKARQKNW